LLAFGGSAIVPDVEPGAQVAERTPQGTLRRQLGVRLAEAGAVLIEAEVIDETEQGDGTDVLNMLTNTYFVFGFPGSRSRSRVSHARRKIHANG
jgi:hypothetical protein